TGKSHPGHSLEGAAPRTFRRSCLKRYAKSRPESRHNCPASSFCLSSPTADRRECEEFGKVPAGEGMFVARAVAFTPDQPYLANPNANGTASLRKRKPLPVASPDSREVAGIQAVVVLTG